MKRVIYLRSKQQTIFTVEQGNRMFRRNAPEKHPYVAKPLILILAGLRTPRWKRIATRFFALVKKKLAFLIRARMKNKKEEKKHK